MTAERCMCGATDCPRCYPGNRPEPTDRHLQWALEEVVDTITDYGQWPANGRAQFSLYDFLLNERDPSFPLELYVSAMSSNTEAFAERIEREHKKVKVMLEDHLIDSDIVYDLACEYEDEEGEE
jgi:hypothetical protein